MTIYKALIGGNFTETLGNVIIELVINKKLNHPRLVDSQLLVWKTTYTEPITRKHCYRGSILRKDARALDPINHTPRFIYHSSKMGFSELKRYTDSPIIIKNIVEFVPNFTSS